MTVLSAKVLGYCMGVRRAVDAALDALENNEKVYSLGPLIHNQSVLDHLSSKGLKIIEEKDIPFLEEKSTVVIRAHGVPPKILKALEERGCNIVNATCPRVVASQKNAQRYSEEDYIVLMAGDSNHGEVTGIAGYAGKKFFLVQNEKEACDLADKIDSNKKTFLLSQTTFSQVEFQKISLVFEKHFKNLKVLNTICSATKERQDALIDLCPKVDGVIVVGGKNSANTKRLFETASKLCEKVILIESANEISEEFLKLNKVGITAGASTPDEIIEGVRKRLSGF